MSKLFIFVKNKVIDFYNQNSIKNNNHLLKQVDFLKSEMTRLTYNKILLTTAHKEYKNKSLLVVRRLKTVIFILILLLSLSFLFNYLLVIRLNNG